MDEIELLKQKIEFQERQIKALGILLIGMTEFYTLVRDALRSADISDAFVDEVKKLSSSFDDALLKNLKRNEIKNDMPPEEADEYDNSD